MSALTEQHIAVLRVLVDAARLADSDVGMDASVLAALLNERDSLASWACASCGARFSQAVQPDLLKGVTHCSSCVMADKMIAEVVQLRTALAAAEQLATQRLNHIRAIEQAIDEGDHWEHTYDGDDGGEWVICNGRDYIAALIADYREGPEVSQ